VERPPSSNTNDYLPPLPRDIEDLFDIYFAFVHTWLPFIDKFKVTAFCRSSPSCPRRVSELTSSQKANLALIWAIVACASLRLPVADGVNSSTEHKTTSLKAAKLSLSLISVLDTEMNHEYVQALVLLAIFYFEYRSHTFSWVLIGIAGRVVVDLSTVAPEQHLSSQSRRTSLACFVVEGIIAAALDRKPQHPSLHNHRQVSHTGFSGDRVCELEAEGWEEWSSWEMPGCNYSVLSSSAQRRGEPFRVLSTFNQAVVLAQILNKANSPNPFKNGDSPRTTIEASLDEPSGLSTWALHVRDSHPSLDPKNVDDAVFPHDINVHAIYWLICCIFHMQNSVLKCDKQQYRDASHHLASCINDLAIKYRSAYPMRPTPLGLTASIMAVSRLLDKDDPLLHTDIFSIARDDQNWAAEEDGSALLFQQAQEQPPPLLSTHNVLAGPGPNRYEVRNHNFPLQLSCSEANKSQKDKYKHGFTITKPYTV
jgi:hypothetical protein